MEAWSYKHIHTIHGYSNTMQHKQFRSSRSSIFFAEVLEVLRVEHCVCVKLAETWTWTGTKLLIVCIRRMKEDCKDN